jgi:hypothetical protein
LQKTPLVVVAVDKHVPAKGYRRKGNVKVKMKEKEKTNAKVNAKMKAKMKVKRKVERQGLANVTPLQCQGLLPVLVNIFLVLLARRWTTLYHYRQWSGQTSTSASV